MRQIAIIFIFFVSVFAQDKIPSEDFNTYVIDALKNFATDGTHTYHWPKSGGWAGNTADLYYQGKLFSKGDSKKRCYCCGLTFEVFFIAYKKYCVDNGWEFSIKDFDSAKLKKFRGQWFGSDGNRKTLLNALETNKLGKKVTFSDAKAGDFVQLWRHSGSGHSVVFISWLRDSKGNITGLQYWSTQTSTNGVHYNTEYFGEKKGLKRSETYIARVGKNSREK
ncbi:hypothetical protein [Candidatus Uabimicrobium sp. HlEnr_7]|uniref:hypothetical protein n=1 Tax=Candidatus Uabimicrobium helgolandensis TaxID=3095367 RepID=UPI003555C0B0